MIDIGICGIGGRMGSTLVRLAGERADMRVRLGIDSEPGEDVVTLDDAAGAVGDVDVLIDFSTAGATRTLLERSSDALAGRALVVGTTGLDADTERMLDQLATRAAVLTAANFSIGVNLLLSVCERVAGVLDAAAWDAEITEAHHSRKVDAPSGTAIALGQAIARGRGVELADVRRDGRSGHIGARGAGEIGMHALRGGNVVGEHTVTFFGGRERIELGHAATDRAVFAEGALAAAAWLAEREPGRYTMRDVLNL